ncbi:winged-helix domain-containing protein [Haladaptatus sp. NG-SE-30]
MRKRAKWMNEKDDIILELLQETGLALPVTPIHENLRLQGHDFTRRTVRRRLKGLESHGLVNSLLGEKGYYQITEQGEAYLSGELDVSELNPND